VRRDLALGRTQPLQGRLGGRHSRVVEHKHRDA
jgi:hypothetical protein